MPNVLSVLAIAATAISAPLFNYENSEDGFSKWAVDNKKDYPVSETFSRFHTWQGNHNFVQQHNKEADAGQHTFWLGMNSLADLSHAEYKATKLGGYRKTSMASKAMSTFDPSTTAAPPASVDWRTHKPKVVSPIKDQAQCGSCWAFSAVEAMEAAAAMNTGKAVTAGSPQQLVDCVDGGKDNCNAGGEMHDGYLEVMKQGGLDSELSYPYEGTSGHMCRFKAGKVVEGTTDFVGYMNVTSGNETSLLAATAARPTISIGIDASSNKFQMYSHGVFNDPFCHNKVNLLDHGVAIVGFGTTALSKDYWIVRNSWGTVWGEEGYIMMSRGKDNQCGVASDATFPIYKKSIESSKN